MFEADKIEDETGGGYTIYTTNHLPPASRGTPRLNGHSRAGSSPGRRNSCCIQILDFKIKIELPSKFPLLFLSGESVQEEKLYYIFL